MKALNPEVQHDFNQQIIAEKVHVGNWSAEAPPEF